MHRGLRRRNRRAALLHKTRTHRRPTSRLRFALALLGIVNKRWRHIEALGNRGRNRLHLSAQLLFNAVQVETVFVGNQINGQSHVTEAT